uniref:Putative FAD/NAD(P)-binding domain-containing protein n=1 Tax=Helianthus annuus TaxID=4232 RepID=A0A251THB6_HELAN
MIKVGGRTPGEKKFSAKFRRKSRPHPLKFLVRTPWNFLSARLGIFCPHPLGFPSFASCGEPYIYGTPALEFPDLIKIMVHGGAECDPDKRTWGAAEGTPKSCLYSMTPDKDYIIDFLGGEFTEDVVVAGGFSGHGFKMAPVVGRMLVDLAIGGAAAAVQRDEEFKHFKVGRFEGNPGGNVKTF